MNWSVPAEPRIETIRGARSALHVITRLDRGGSADNTLSTCIGLAARGWDVTLAYGRSIDPSPLLPGAAATLGLRLIEIPQLIREISPLYDARAYRHLSAMARGRAGYDVVHTHSSKAGILGRLAWRNTGIPVVHTPHGHVFHGYLSGPLTRMAIHAERRAARWCRKIVVLTDRGREEHLEADVGTPGQYVTIPSGVDLDHFEQCRSWRVKARSGLGIPEEARVVGTVARLVEIKGIRYLVEAAEDLARRDPDLVLLLVGDGDLRPSLEKQVASGPLRNRAIFTGSLEDPAPALAAMDAFALPSLNEGQGRAAVEAMAAGIPVAASDVGGLPDVLDQGRAGILVPPATPAALAAALGKLLYEPEAGRTLASAALRRIRGRYDVESMVDSIERLYLEILAQEEEER